jgi:hypothetical protein
LQAIALEHAREVASHRERVIESYIERPEALSPLKEIKPGCWSKNSHANKGCAWKDLNHKVLYYDSGSFVDACDHCSARLLAGEKKRYKKAGNTKCCMNGRVWTPAVQRDYHRLQNPPPLFKDLCDVDVGGGDAELFMEHAKQLNSFFAFASVMANYKQVEGRGVKPVIMVITQFISNSSYSNSYSSQFRMATSHSLLVGCIRQRGEKEVRQCSQTRTSRAVRTSPAAAKRRRITSQTSREALLTPKAMRRRR